MTVSKHTAEPRHDADQVPGLADRFALIDLAERYLLDLDERNFGEAQARSVFTEDVVLSFPAGSHQGRAGVAEFTRGFMAYWAHTQHVSSNYRIDVEHDAAALSWNVIATHVHDDSSPDALGRHFQLGARFSASAVHTERGWRMRELTLRILWTTGQGNPAVTVDTTDSPGPRANKLPTQGDTAMSATDAATAEVQRVVVDKIWLEGLNQGDLSIADDYLTADFRNHGSHDDSLTGPEAFKLTIRKQRSGFSDIKYEILDFVSQGDRCAVRWVMRGRHTGEFLGVPPTGKEVEHHAVLILRFEDGKIAERWGVVDNYALLRFLQAPATLARP